MKKKNAAASAMKKFVCGVLAFFLSLVLFLLTICVVISFTVFDSNAFMGSMSATGYYGSKQKELTENLTDLGYASGIPETFFESFVDKELIAIDTKVYLSDFDSGTDDVVNADTFKERFSAALDQYIADKKIQNVNESSKEYLVKTAGKVYQQTLGIPLFHTISSYYLTAKRLLPFMFAGLGAIAVLLIFVLVFTNHWRHRKFKYLCYASGGTFLALLTIPIFLTVNGGARHINLESEALYRFVVHFVDNFTFAFWIAAGVFLLFTIVLFINYVKTHHRSSR